MKRIVFSDEAKADIRAIPQPIALNILHAIHRLADSGSGNVKALKGQSGDCRLRVGDFRVRFTVEPPATTADAPGEQSEATLHIHSVADRKDAYR